MAFKILNKKQREIHQKLFIEKPHVAQNRKATQRKYDLSIKGKARYERYRQSKKGKTYYKIYTKEYRQTHRKQRKDYQKKYYQEHKKEKNDKNL